MSIRSSAWWRAPGTGVDVTMVMNASAGAGRSVRPLSGFAFSAATAASNAADSRASASGSRLIWVWHMPSRSIHRLTVRCDRSFSWCRRPSSREDRRARSRTLRANASTDVDAACSTSSGAIAASSTRSSSSSRLLLGRSRRRDQLTASRPPSRRAPRASPRTPLLVRRPRRPHTMTGDLRPTPAPASARPPRHRPSRASTAIGGDRQRTSSGQRCRTSSDRSPQRTASPRRDRWPT